MVFSDLPYAVLLRKVQTWDFCIFNMLLCSTLAYLFITGLAVSLLFLFLLTSYQYCSVTDINALSPSVSFLLLPQSNFSAYAGYMRAQNILLRVLFLFSGCDASEAR